MLHLAMAPLLPRQIPTIGFHLAQQIANFQRTGADDIRASRPSVAFRKNSPAEQYSESLFSLCSMWGGGAFSMRRRNSFTGPPQSLQRNSVSSSISASAISLTFQNGS